MKSLSDIANIINGQSMFKVLAKTQELEAQGNKIFHLELGEPYFDSPKEVLSVTCKALHDGKTHYTNSMGINELRDAIAEDCFNLLQFIPKRERVVVLPAHAIIYFTIACLVNPDEEVIYPDPGFPSYLAAIKLVGAKPIPVQLKEENGFRLQPEDVEKLITSKTKLIIINSPSNPTGAVMDNKEIFGVVQLAERHDLYLLSDETYSKIIYNGIHWSPARLLDKCVNRVIVLSSFSKCYAMTGFRLGYAIAPENIVEKLGLMVQTTISCVPQFIQEAGIVALKKCDYWNRSIVEKLRIQRDWVVEELNKMGLTCSVPSGAFYVMPNISKTGMTSQKFCDLMLENGVALLSGTDFGQYGEGFVRISYAGKPENLHGAINKMKEVLK
jgi:aspartate/methionine/tyrosine aminotransferase